MPSSLSPRANFGRMMQLIVLALALGVIFTLWPKTPHFISCSVNQTDQEHLCFSTLLDAARSGWKISVVLNGTEVAMIPNGTIDGLVNGERTKLTKYVAIVKVVPESYEYYFQASLGRIRYKTSPCRITVTRRQESFHPLVFHVPLSDTSNLRGPYQVRLQVNSSKSSKVTLVYSLGNSTRFEIPMSGSRGTYRAEIPGPRVPCTVYYHFLIESAVGDTFLYPQMEDGQQFFHFRVYRSGGTTEQFIFSTLKSNGAFGPLFEQTSGLFWTYYSLLSLEIVGANNDPRLELTSNWLRRQEETENNPISRSMALIALDSLGVLPENRTFSKQFLKQAIDNLVNPVVAKVTYRETKQLLYLTKAFRTLDDSLPQLPAQWWDMLLSRQNPDGGWPLVDGPSHISATYFAVSLLSEYGKPIPRTPQVADFVLRYQNDDGAFACRPGLSSDIRYTYYALAILKAIGSQVPRKEALVSWLALLMNPDGGFGDRPTWASRSESTFYCLSSFQLLGAKPPRKATAQGETTGKFDPTGLKIYRAEFEAPGSGLPGEVVDYRAKIGIHLVGLKSDMAFASQARDVAKRLGTGQLILYSPEEYGVKYRVPGYGLVDHISEFIGPVGRNYGHRYFGEGNWPSYEDFKKLGIEPVHANEGLFFTDFLKPFDVFDEIVSDSLGSEDSYDMFAAIVGGQDALLSNPEFRKYVGHVPLVANTDSHYDSWRERGKTNVACTIYMARNGTWKGFVDAVRRNNVACVIRDRRGLMIYGKPELVDYLYETVETWRWWDRFSSKCYAFISAGSYSRKLFNDTAPFLVLRSSHPILSATIDGAAIDLEAYSPESLSGGMASRLPGLALGSHEVTVFTKGDHLVQIEMFVFDFRNDEFTPLSPRIETYN